MVATLATSQKWPNKNIDQHPPATKDGWKDGWMEKVMKQFSVALQFPRS
jgi:hypothetical protein